MQDRVVLVTGAGRGIGRATALLAGASGWSVGVNYTSDDGAADAVVSEISRGGGRAVAVKADISQEQDVLAMFDAVTRRLGPLTGFVGNAGINLPRSNLVDMTAERVSRIFAVNAVGAYLCAREAARRMARSRGGTGGAIVSVSSVAARLGSPNEYVDYAGSKAAIDAMTLGLSKELGPEGIRVNAVRPGLIETEIHAAAGDPDRVVRSAGAIPLGRAGTAEEVAQAVIWLLSDQASYVNGALVDVGGGR